jgi:predicted Rossmann fold flavoprotein
VEKNTGRRVFAVIGGGAAGFFAAVNAARLHSDLNVIILEKSDKLLSKVRVSGGGRCNVTHACYDNRLLVKNYPRGERELIQAFSRFSTGDTVSWFHERGVELKTEDDGRMFPVTDDSQTIVDCLLSEADRYNVQIICKAGVHEIIPENDQWKITFEGAMPALIADKVLIATGGGRNVSAFSFLKQTKHTIVHPVPSLFTFNIKNKQLTELMGVSVPDAKVSIPSGKAETQGPLLITHWGMSGPAVLKTSSLAARELEKLQYRFDVHINWMGSGNPESMFEELCDIRKSEAQHKCDRSPFETISRRLWEYFIGKSVMKSDLRWGDVSNKNLRRLAEILTRDVYAVDGKTTFKEEFVTCGGISRKEIDFSTMESKLQKGLFFAGEVIDIDAVTGGFNFQNAWTTGWIVGNGVS